MIPGIISELFYLLPVCSFPLLHESSWPAVTQFIQFFEMLSAQSFRKRHELLLGEERNSLWLHRPLEKVIQPLCLWEPLILYVKRFRSRDLFPLHVTWWQITKKPSEGGAFPAGSPDLFNKGWGIHFKLYVEWYIQKQFEPRTCSLVFLVFQQEILICSPGINEWMSRWTPFEKQFPSFISDKIQKPPGGKVWCGVFFVWKSKQNLSPPLSWQRLCPPH